MSFLSSSDLKAMLHKFRYIANTSPSAEQQPVRPNYISQTTQPTPTVEPEYVANTATFKPVRQLSLKHDYVWPAKAKRVVGLDVETTGINRGRDRITQLGVCGNCVKKTSILIDPETETGNDPTKIKGITRADIVSMKPIRVYLDFIYEVLHDAIVVIHNQSHDMAFIQHEFERHGRAAPVPERVICTLNIVRQLKLPGSKSLKNLMVAFNVNLQNWHNAGDDAEAHYRLLIVLANRYWAIYFKYYYTVEFEVRSRHMVAENWLFNARLNPPKSDEPSGAY